MLVSTLNIIKTYNSESRNADQSRCTAIRPVMRPAASMYTRPAFAAPNFDCFGVAVQRTIRSLQFWRKVLTIWASFKITQVSIAFQSKFRQSEWPRRAWDQQHDRAGDMMLDLCTSMKGFYVKAGQLIALQAFVPSIIREKLGRLHDNMPPMPPETAKEIVENELQNLGQTLDIFEPIDFTTVLGSASIAQVHRAKLRNGEEVAIKIQHVDMERRMMSDLANFRLLGEVLQRTELKFDLVSPVQELKKQIRLEFDFENEARGMLAIRRSLRHLRGISVPGVIPGLVSKSLLVMTFVEGTPMTRLATVIGNRGKRTVRSVGRKILNHLADGYGKMILTDGFFQADCHPGNVLVTNPKVDIALLDFGQTKRLTEKQRIGFACLVHAMARKDEVAIAKGMRRLGIEVRRNTMNANTVSARSHLTLEEKLAYTMFDTAAVRGVSDNPFSAESALREGSVSDLPKDLVFLLRTLQIIKGICKATYNDDFSMVSAWRRVARREVRKAELD